MERSLLLVLVVLLAMLTWLVGWSFVMALETVQGHAPRPVSEAPATPRSEVPSGTADRP